MTKIYRLLKILVIILITGVPLYLLIGSIATLHLGWWYILVFPIFLYVQFVFFMTGFVKIWILYGMPEKMRKMVEVVRIKQGLPPRVD